jgi:acyl-CoA synthetase (AMP-forming)/AMP-acid ligase II
MEGLTVGDVLRRAAERVPDRDGLVDANVPDGRRWTYADLLADAERIARGLLTRFEPGERVASSAPNRAELVLLQYGTALARLTLVPLNPLLRPNELAYVLGQSGAAGIVTAEEHRGHRLAETVAALGLREVIVLGDDWEELLSDASDGPAELPGVGPDDLGQIQYTSGTTGNPKGVLISHRGMALTAEAFAERLHVSDGAAWLNPMPLFHTAGNVLGGLGAAWACAPHVTLAFDPGRTLAAIAAERPGFVSAAPTLLHAVLEHPAFRSTDVRAVEIVVTGGSVLEPAFVRHLEASFAAPLSITFGMTETCGAICVGAPEDAQADRETTVGRPLPHTEVMVARTGELLVRGPRVTKGYHDMPEETALAIDAEGWLHTGDLGSMDERGYVRIEGRLKDMIKRGGENIAPAEVEACLAEHAAVAEAAVVGLPDERWGEVVVAYVRPVPGSTPDVEELVAHCRERLASFKLPRRWAFVDAMPLTASGKIRRAELRERAVRERDELIAAS